MNWKKILLGKAPSFTRRLGSGIHIKIGNRMEWLIFTDIFVEGDYDQPILALFSKPSAAVVDLGCNVGFFVQRLMDLAVRHHANTLIDVFAIDGSPSLCKEAGLRIRESTMPSTIHVGIVPGMIGLKNGDGTLYEFADHGLNSAFRKSGKKNRYPYLDLSSELAGLKAIDLLKCDIEGSERLFLENYPDILAKTSAAVFEFHPEFIDYDACVSLLTSAGFRYRKIVQQYPGTIVEYFQKSAT